MRKTLFFLTLLIVIASSCSVTEKRIQLSGNWNVQADTIRRMIQLPGSLSENGVGYTVTDSATNMLSEQVRFVGKAAYEREVEIPDSWGDREIELYMERTKVSEVFINGSSVGSRKSISTPHVYRVKDLIKPGKNKITIMVDNTKSLLPLGGAHAYSEHTQTNWNGILGDFHLRLIDDIDIRDVQVYPLNDGLCQLKITLQNNTSERKEKQQLSVTIFDPEKKRVAHQKLTTDIAPGLSLQKISLIVPNPKLWDEYTPHLYSLQAEVAGSEKKGVTFGFRNFTTQSSQFTNNGRVVFLRGTHEGGVFPISGYPSMQKEDWINYFNTVKSYGINHVRYHSWTPPLAAFNAADECGVFIQPELPLWGSYTPGDTVLFNYMKKESEKIMQNYGNHPSFVLFALGNELTGDTTLMNKMVKHLKELDSRHLYAFGSNNFYWDTHTHPNEDFFVSMRNGKEVPDYSTDLRGSFSFADSKDGGIINSLKPNTQRNFAEAIETLEKPVVGHETGQYQVYPNYKEMKKYTGVMQARNFAVFKKRLEKAGMSSQAEKFLKASGALCALCYREEIEMALRTPNFGGFQLLDLKDYPGQGTALVGILDAFLDSKDIISREQWTGFCNDVVPLALFPKFCWTNNEVFTAHIEVANYGQKELKEQPINCLLKDVAGNVLFEKRLTGTNLSQGKLSSVETLSIPLEAIKSPQQLRLVVELEGTSYKNSWDVWVYPADSSITIKEGIIQGVMVTRNKKVVEEAKNKGLPVLYIPWHKDIADQSVGGLFTTDFWNYGVFKSVAESMKKIPSPGTMGIVTDPNHSLLKGFPTDFHTNWQWWNLIKNSRPMILDQLPESYFPIVQVVDNIERNHKLGLIYEWSDTESKVVVCTADLFACPDEPEVKAMFKSLLEYLRQ